MPHPLVDQLRFARSEWRRDLEGVSEEDAGRRLLPMNSIGWMVGHLAWHEQLSWLRRAQDLHPVPELETMANGAAASTPSLARMWDAWGTVAAAADPWLDALTTTDMTRRLTVDGRPWRADIGTMLQRVTYHYWSHIGEASAIRQLLGHADPPQFVGDIEQLAPYRPEPPA